MIQLNNQTLMSAAGGIPDPSACTGMTWEEIRANPDEFRTRWAEYKADNPKKLSPIQPVDNKLLIQAHIARLERNKRPIAHNTTKPDFFS